MHYIIKRLLTVSVLLPQFVFAQNSSDNKALLEVIINGEDVGAYPVILKAGDVFIPTTVFKNWRLKKQLWSEQAKEVSLQGLAPHLQYTVDNNKATLEISATPDSFEAQVLETPSQYTQAIPKDVIHPATWSGFVNYSFDVSFNQLKGFDTFSAPWEVGLTSGKWFAFSSFNSNYTSSEHRFQTVRNDTYLQWEDTQTRQKVTLGDFFVNSPTLAIGGRFGGLLWQSNFRQYGQFQYMPSFDMNFNVQTPSHAELYVNDVKTKEWDVLPGMVSLPSLLTSGQGNASLVLTDAFGRQQYINQPFYVTQQLLKKGLHDFYYAAGMQRNPSLKAIDYGSFVFSGSHRYGFTDTLSAGMALSISRKVSNWGANLTHTFAGSSLINTNVSMSHQGGLTGYLAIGTYQLNLRQLNLAIDAAYLSQHYGNLIIDADSLQKNKYRLQASFNYSVPVIGSSFGASFSQSGAWDSPKITHAISLSYRQSLFSSVSLNARVNHDLSTGDNVASLTLNYFPQTEHESDILHNNNLSYQLSYDDKTHVDKQVWQTQKQGNTGEGYNYTAAFQKQDEDYSGFARYQYKNNNGIYNASYAQDKDSIRGSVGMAGSLATVNNAVYFARPISDSFAVVKVNGADENVTVYQDGAFLGTAQNDKTVVIPTLQSRRVGKVSIKSEELGMAVVPDKTEQTIEVGVRTANVVEFNLSRFVAVEGRAYILAADGKKEYLEALPLDYLSKGKLQHSFIAKKGFFYLENIPAGEFTATVKRYKNDCVLHLTIPKTNQVVAKLGDVQCVAE